jgi:DNA mismatch endonuclease (patch repair protein)
MARIPGRDTTPEIIVRKLLWCRGVRYRIGFRTPGGRADFALPGRRFAVFIDGCFWHGCPEHYVRPRSSKPFWDHKLLENLDRDRRQTQGLLDAGWTCVRVWEHEVREAPEAVAALVLDQLEGGGRGRWPNWRVARVEFLDTRGDLERRHLEALLGEGWRQEEGPRTTAKVGRVSRKPATK